MMEENVVSASGTTKIMAAEAELQHAILRAGFIPQKRDSDYHHLPTILVEDKLTTPPPIQPN
jgi:2-iminoacetate synthase ThiH